MTQPVQQIETKRRLAQEFGARVSIEHSKAANCVRIVLTDAAGLCVGLGIGRSVEQAESWMRAERARRSA